MNQTKGKRENVVEIKMPFLTSIIIVLIIFIVVAKIYSLNSNNEVEAAEIVQDMVQEETQEVVQQEETENIMIEEEIVETQQEQKQEEPKQEEPKTVTYTAQNGKQYDIIARLNIPSLGIEYPILATTSESLLKVSLTKYWGANPNEVGNMVVLGHNYKNSKFFGKLPNIEMGAIVKITDLTGKTVDYKVYDTYKIEPEDNDCTSQLTNGQTEITLITCAYENGNPHATKRFVAKARAY